MMAPATDRVALLIVRLWLEDGEGDRRLRARLTATPDLNDRTAAPTVTAAGGIDDVCDQVRAWLHDFLAAAELDSSR
jgi:hypothetical protein